MKGCMQRRWLWFSLILVGLAGGSVPAAGAENAPPAMLEEATVSVWNRDIVVLRAPIQNISPAERAQRIQERIEALSVSGPWVIAIEAATLGQLTGVVVTVDGDTLFGLTMGDADPESGVSVQKQAERAATRLKEFLEARKKQMTPGLLLRGLLKALAATVLFVLVLAVVRRLRRWANIRLDRGGLKAANLRLGDVEVRPFVIAIFKGCVQVVRWVLILVATYVWFGYVCNQFPYSRPWGSGLRDALLDTAKLVGTAFVEAVPGLFMVVVICIVTRFLAGLVSVFFRNVEHGLVRSRWLQPDTARATRRIVMALMWAFALTVAYPYIPGSQTAAFKGVSVFIGLMFSLGSAGMINQVISGLLVVYSRAFQTGEFVRVGETEGVVTAVGLLSTKILTSRNEEVTVPNALLISNPAWNFSSFGGGQGASIGAAVTIGYDTPWRQVHAMLLEAAGKTAGIKKNPEPYVLQRALSDFYVEYHLLSQLEDPRTRVRTLSLLHQAVQDAFNEHGVQIMSPHFVSQPDKQVVVPKAKWFDPPARKEADGRSGAGRTSDSRA